MKKKDETKLEVTITGCSDCPFCHQSHGQGADDYVCVYLKQYANVTKNYILDDCPLKCEKEIIIRRPLVVPF